MTDRDEQMATVRDLVGQESATPANIDGTGGDLQRLCAALVRALPARSAGVTLFSEAGTQPAVAVSWGPQGQQVEEQQHSFGEGPCIDAFTSRRPVLVSDLRVDVGRWPGYAPAAQELGVSAVFSFPMQIGAARLGVLNVYRDQPGMLSAVAVNQSLTFAEYAVRTLLDGQRRATATSPVDGLEPAVDSRSELFQAQGMVMIQLGVSLVESMARLRAHAFATNRRLGDVARDVVARTLQLESDDTSQGPR